MPDETKPQVPANESVPENKTPENDVEITDDEKSVIDPNISKKVETMSFQKKYWRDKAASNARELEEYKKQHPPTTPIQPTSPAFSQATPPTVDVEGAARKVALEIKRDEQLAGLPEDKQQSVKDVFTALTAGKEVTVSNLNSYMETAMRAVGVEIRQNNSNRIITSSGGNVPPRTPPGPTNEQIALAKKLGNDPNKVYGKDADYSNMIGADKFINS